MPDETERSVNRALKESRRSAPSPASTQVSGSVYKQPFAVTGADDRLGRRDRGAAADRRADAGRARLPDHGALRHAGGDLRPARRQRRQRSTSGSPRRCALAFAEQEGTAFVTGNGTNKPKGFLAYTEVANASWSWGNIGFIATGVAGGFPADATRATS